MPEICTRVDQRRDAQILGLPLPFALWALWALAPFRIDAVHAGSRVPHFVAVRPHSLRDAHPAASGRREGVALMKQSALLSS